MMKRIVLSVCAAVALNARAEQSAGSQTSGADKTPRTVLDLPSTAENPRNSEGAFLPLSSIS